VFVTSDLFIEVDAKVLQVPVNVHIMVIIVEGFLHAGNKERGPRLSIATCMLTGFNPPQ